MITAAIVGLGWWGATIASDLATSDKIRPVLGVDPDPARRESAHEQAGIETTASFDDALASPSVDAVVLCSPHWFHTDQIVAAAKAGKHVFCEKPFATSSAGARDALAAVEAAGVQVGIGHERRFEPAVEELQRLVRDGELGTPLVFEGNFSQDKFLALPPDNWRLSAELSPAGPLSATGIHMVDLAISVLGRPVEVWARLGTLATSFANGDTLSITLAFESGATATITAVLTTPFIGRVCVLGSQGWAEIRDRSHPEKSEGWDVVVSRRGEENEKHAFPAFSGVRANLERFAGAAEGADPYPVTPAEIQLNADTFEAIVRSASSGRVERV
ncbi:Gfo/Idh/MocA family oxidoreductase [Amycolatopsis acidicola]|uniref:Gfo/Idh/MocA family oxidoreductase n=1 Tax=Amycolatopsis acidicola TaxID=2596893 RepID=A0A5N0V3Z7_9PSEU|nr:Gfo/Idh/MocA family oxidoreductase [Amycolatopsis acidicola]KAA9160695.1 Gfo/Idh/MocA family oxidoreductase [Amycolatopsis acidicola]